MNLEELSKHAGAYGIYMISSVIRYGTHEVWARIPENEIALDVFLIGTVIWVIGSFVSQFFLCIIIWTLSKKIEISRKTHIETMRKT